MTPGIVNVNEVMYADVNEGDVNLIILKSQEYMIDGEFDPLCWCW